MEASLCDYLSAAVEPHVHGMPETHSFEVVLGPRRRALYVPSIILTHTAKDGETILIEPIDSDRPGGGIRRLQAFRMAHHSNYFLIVVARRVLHRKLPADAYDLLVPLEDFEPLDDFLRTF
jgi:hypothetical protein